MDKQTIVIIGTTVNYLTCKIMKKVHITASAKVLSLYSCKSLNSKDL